MKRTPLRRKTALQQKTALKRTPFKRKRQSDAKWTTVRKKVIARAGGLCEARWEGCYGKVDHVHHILRRSQGGTDDPSNLLACCFHCHHMIHNNISLAVQKGHLFSRKACD